VATQHVAVGLVVNARKGKKMPSLIRFLTLTGALAGIVLGGLYVLATYYEPETAEVRKSVPSVSIRRD